MGPSPREARWCKRARPAQAVTVTAMGIRAMMRARGAYGLATKLRTERDVAYGEEQHEEEYESQCECKRGSVCLCVRTLLHVEQVHRQSGASPGAPPVGTPRVAYRASSALGLYQCASVLKQQVARWFCNEQGSFHCKLPLLTTSLCSCRSTECFPSSVVVPRPGVQLVTVSRGTVVLLICTRKISHTSRFTSGMRQ